MASDDEKPFALSGAPEQTGGPAAVKSLYGEGHANATRTRECVAMPGLREQEILTPPSILSAVREVWPEGIALDPCCPTWCNPTGAAKVYTGGEADDGLREPWVERTFANVPFGELGTWLGKAAREAETFVEIMVLGPVRPHRDWAGLGLWDRVCLLRPVVFVGFKSAHPEPLCIRYAGTRLKRFDRAFARLGEVGTWTQTFVRQGVLL